METLQTRTFYAKEKKSLAYVIGLMNLILHGIEAPNLIHTNTLTENLAHIQEKDRYDLVLAKMAGIATARISESMMGVVANPKEAEVGFIEYLLQSYKACLQALGKGSAQANINMGTFENERFPFPPVAEQRQIVTQLDALSAETPAPRGALRAEAGGAGEEPAASGLQRGAVSRQTTFHA